MNDGGLDFYERLVDTLLENGIQPMATLYHWDLPAALDDRGGWLNPDVADWFADYAGAVFRRLDDRVQMWTTLNEPWVVADGGYLHGALAPGHRNLFEAPIASHHLLRAHGAAVRAYRAEGRHQIGLVVNLEPKHAASDKPEDVAAARARRRLHEPAVPRPGVPRALPRGDEGDLRRGLAGVARRGIELIREPIDFLGINYYTRGVIRHDELNCRCETAACPSRWRRYTETGWEVYPQGLTEILVWVKERYGDLPLYVTENGAAFYDPPCARDGRVDDPLRVDYFRDHLRAVHDAIEAGVDLRGYFAWSLLDNFEWSLGYSKRFGIVHVDFETQERTPKDSARFYTEVIASRGAALGAGG